ncbi:MAG TPA: hypothetical protein VF137_10480 [Candidatus Dormibacteraeota bacterium]
MKKPALVLVGAIVLLIAVACGDQNSVGSAGALQHIPSPSPVAPSPSPSPTHVAVAPPPVVQHSTQPPPPAQQTVTIDIITNSPYLTPQGVKISHGTIVKFVNQDQQPDKIEVQNSAGGTVATSGSIAPGGVWSFTFSSPGGYTITDRRPYAQDPVSVT